MHNFSDFNIKPAVRTLVGTKVTMLFVLNKEITVHSYLIKPSKHHKGDCVHMQISIGESMHPLFTGSSSLMGMISQVPLASFPFKATIVKKDDIFQFV